MLLVDVDADLRGAADELRLLAMLGLEREELGERRGAEERLLLVALVGERGEDAVVLLEA